MKIRDFTSSDNLSTIADWYAREWFNPEDRARLEEFLEKALREKRIYSLKVATVPATDSGPEQLIGCASLQERDMGEARLDLTPWLAGVYVDPKFRGQKLGENLTDAIVAEARARKFKVLYLYTDKMAAWYTKLGWRTISQEKYKGLDVTVMELKLT